MAQHSGVPANVIVRTLHIHLSFSTPGGLARAGAVLAAILPLPPAPGAAAVEPAQPVAPAAAAVPPVAPAATSAPPVAPAAASAPPVALGAAAAPPLPPAEPQEPGDDDVSFCSICQSFGSNSRLPCGHRFHSNCIHRWLLRAGTCADPYCGNFYVVDDVQPI